MQKGIRESGYLEEYLCDNHTLQLVIKDTFDQVEGMKRLLKKCKDLAKMTHQSTSVANQQLKDKCKQMGIKFAKLKNPCETRWNSYYDCSRSVLRLKNVLQVLFTEEESDLWSPHALSLASPGCYFSPPSILGGDEGLGGTEDANAQSGDRESVHDARDK